MTPRIPLDGRPKPPRFRDLQASADAYQPPDGLLDAADVAVALGAPLLVTGEPGTGKTQAAYYLARVYEVPPARVFRMDVRSSSTAEDLTARLDTIAYFHAAHDPLNQKQGVVLDKKRFYVKGPLYHAYREADGASVVLVDEIDKAPRDFPNDLLDTLDQHRFMIRETQDEVRLDDGISPPLVVITSNTERRLPDPFLRRCIYHHIEFDQALVERVVQAHADDLQADGALVDAAIGRFLELRDDALELRKRPSTGELLNWLHALHQQAVDPRALADAPPSALPCLSALVKSHDDLDRLRRA